MAEYKDIPTRLREATKRTDLPAGILVLLSEAYAEFCEMERKIETLKRDLDETEGINGTLMIGGDSLRKQRDELEVRIKSIKEGFEGCCTSCEPVGEINKKLREERDEARQFYCEKMSMQSRQQDCTPQWFAEEMDWDCFKDNFLQDLG
jgi:hypothetical protein